MNFDKQHTPYSRLSTPLQSLPAVTILCEPVSWYLSDYIHRTTAPHRRILQKLRNPKCKSFVQKYMGGEVSSDAWCNISLEGFWHFRRDIIRHWPNFDTFTPAADFHIGTLGSYVLSFLHREPRRVFAMHAEEMEEYFTSGRWRQDLCQVYLLRREQLREDLYRVMLEQLGYRRKVLNAARAITPPRLHASSNQRKELALRELEQKPWLREEVLQDERIYLQYILPLAGAPQCVKDNPAASGYSKPLRTIVPSLTPPPSLEKGQQPTPAKAPRLPRPFILLNIPKTGTTYAVHYVSNADLLSTTSLFGMMRILLRSRVFGLWRWKIQTRLKLELPHGYMNFDEKHTPYAWLLAQLQSLPAIAILREPVDWYMSDYLYRTRKDSDVNHTQRLQKLQRPECKSFVQKYMGGEVSPAAWHNISLEGFWHFRRDIIREWRIQDAFTLAADFPIGALGCHVLGFLHREPGRIFTMHAEEVEEYFASGHWCQDLCQVYLLRQEQLREDLYRVMLEQLGYRRIPARSQCWTLPWKSRPPARIQHPPGAKNAHCGNWSKNPGCARKSCRMRESTRNTFSPWPKCDERNTAVHGHTAAPGRRPMSASPSPKPAPALHTASDQQDRHHLHRPVCPVCGHAQHDINLGYDTHLTAERTTCPHRQTPSARCTNPAETGYHQAPGARCANPAEAKQHQEPGTKGASQAEAGLLSWIHEL